MNRRSHTLSAPVLLLSLFLLAPPVSAQDFFATITDAGHDQVTINAGRNAEVEVGDILVVQSGGMKKGLVRVVTASRDSAVAETVRTEPGSRFERGDLVAYQLLQSDFPMRSTAAPLEPGEHGFMPRQEEELPPWMGGAARTGRKQTSYTRFPDQDARIESLKDVLARSPADRRAMCSLADLYFQKGWYDQSIIWNQRAVEADPDAPDNDKLLHQIATTYAKMGDYEKYDIYMNHIRRYYPDSVFAYESDAGGRLATPALSTPRTLGHGSLDYRPSYPARHASLKRKRLGVGATIEQPPPETLEEVQKGKVKIIPIKKTKSKKKKK